MPSCQWCEEEISEEEATHNEGLCDECADAFDSYPPEEQEAYR